MTTGAAPPLPEIHRFRDAAALAEGTAAWLAGALIRAVLARGRAGLAVAGGSTPRAMHGRLAAADRRPAIDWRAVTVYVGDERCVPPNDPASNYRMVRESLVDLLRVPPAQLVRIEGDLPADEAARRYHARLAAAPPLDVVVLGMGDDGHVASWFPDTPPFDRGALAQATRSPQPPHERVTLTARAIAGARDVVLLVSGAGKAARLAEVYGEIAAGAPRLPAAQVRSASGAVHWFVDDAAASQLPVQERG